MTIARADVGGYQKESDEFIHSLMTDRAFYIRQLFDEMDWERVAPLGEVEIDIFLWMSDPKGPQKRGTFASRGCGKSHLVVGNATRGFLRDPNRKIVAFAKAAGEAKKTLALCRECIERVWFLQHLRPTATQKDSATEFLVGPAVGSRQASFTALGIDGSIPGNRAHEMIPDDAETDENTQSEEARETLFGKFTKIDPLLYPDRPASEGGPVDPTCVNVIGTRQHDTDSVYDRLPALGYIFRSWTLTVPEPRQTARITNLAPLIIDRLEKRPDSVGRPTMPHRFDARFVAEKLAFGQAYYDQQYQQCAPDKNESPYTLRLSDLIVVEAINPFKAPLTIQWGTASNMGTTAIAQQLIPNLGHQGDRLHRPIFTDQHQSAYTGVKAYIDPAGVGSDLTGLAICGHLAGMLWMPVWRGLPGGASPEDIDRLLLLCRDWNAREILYERNIDTFDTFGQALQSGIARHAIQPGKDPHRPEGWTAVIVPRHAKGRKGVRMAQALGPVIQSHRLIVADSELKPDRLLKPHQQLQYQLSRLTRDGELREDGAADAGASIIAEWKDVLGHDPARLAERRKTQEHEDHVANALREQYGFIPRKSPRMWTTRR